MRFNSRLRVAVVGALTGGALFAANPADAFYRHGFGGGHYAGGGFGGYRGGGFHAGRWAGVGFHGYGHRYRRVGYGFGGGYYGGGYDGGYYGGYAAYGGGYGGYGAYGYASPYAYVNPNITQYVNAGVVSYPIYRVDHYKVDYANPYYVTNGGCGACGGW